MKILVLNAGSSSQKCCLYEVDKAAFPNEAVEPIWKLQIDWSHKPDAQVEVTTHASGQTQTRLPVANRQAGLAKMISMLWAGDSKILSDPSQIDVVGHRVVHGGEELREPTVITDQVKTTIDTLSVLAPEHNPASLEGIKAAQELFSPKKLQIAVFDTAFHSHMPSHVVTYPGPYDWLSNGIRRYGFHGISHEYCANRVAQMLNKDLKTLKLITCHLGNGCSLAAVRNGQSVNTTMGFTPMEGLMMGSRSGTIDPGILIHFLQNGDYSVDRLNTVLNKESGLKGISGISNDLREILQAASKNNERAQLALDMFTHHVSFYIGAMLSSLAGLDAIVFTGGMGENSQIVRANACQPFNFLGVEIDSQKNQNCSGDSEISTTSSKVKVFAIRAQEDWAIAKKCWDFASKKK